MKFNEMIEGIMPLVREGDKSIPFILSRINSEWEINYVNINTNADNALNFLRESDPYAVMFTGDDFGKGSFPHVYDRIVNERLRSEYENADFPNIDLAELGALINMIEENVGEFTQEETDYLMMYDRPLAALYDMNKISLVSRNPDEDYNYAQTGAFFTAIGDEIHDKLYNFKKQEIPAGLEGSEKPDKRNIEGYEEKICLQIAGKFVIIAENPEAADPYLVVNIRRDNPLGLEERYDGAVTADYVEAMREFVTRVDGFVGQLETERRESGLPFQTMTATDCIPDSYKGDYEGKLVIIKPEILAPEYRSAEHQLAICTGGFGANAEARGRAVFVKNLFNGKESGYDRTQIAGVANPSKLPNWAVDKLLEHQNKNELSVGSDVIPQADKKSPEKPKKPATLEEKLNKAKKKAAEQDTAKKDERGDKPKKHEERE